MSATVPQLLLVLGDQLSPDLASLQAGNKKNDRVLMVEVQEEATYARHHKKKTAFIFSAMRHFAAELKAAGWTVDYVKLDDGRNTGTFLGELKRAIKRIKPQRVLVTEASEYRVREMFLPKNTQHLGVPIEIFSDTRFICSPEEFASWADGRKELRMEVFYREMRRKTGLLMVDGKPEGGRWNFDKENRKPAQTDLFMPALPSFENDAITKRVCALVKKNFADHFGALEPFSFAVTRKDAEKARDWFIENALPHFGDYQDAMLRDEKFLYHSVLSHYLNCGLLDPMDLCERAAQAYYDGKAPLNSVEGYIRQIIGWREYVRGIYWLHMPDYVTKNFFEASRALPSFYWTGDTDMACVASVVKQTHEEAYAHHIQRLMITGNFALLAGIDPHEVHEWYLSVYADAYEWVELPNTLGMSQFADGGLLGSKPYAASANYISKMSDYCRGCSYDPKQKSGEKACPFNALYWDFLARNQAKLANNRRLTMPYATWRKMDPKDKKMLRASAKSFLDQLS